MKESDKFRNQGSKHSQRLREDIAQLIEMSPDDTTVFDIINALALTTVDVITENFNTVSERKNAFAALSQAYGRREVQQP